MEKVSWLGSDDVFVELICYFAPHGSDNNLCACQSKKVSNNHFYSQLIEHFHSYSMKIIQKEKEEFAIWNFFKLLEYFHGKKVVNTETVMHACVMFANYDAPYLDNY